MTKGALSSGFLMGFPTRYFSAEVHVCDFFFFLGRKILRPDLHYGDSIILNVTQDMHISTRQNSSCCSLRSVHFIV